MGEPGAPGIGAGVADSGSATVRVHERTRSSLGQLHVGELSSPLRELVEPRLESLG